MTYIMFVVDDSMVSTANGGSMKDRIPLAPLQKLAWFNLIVFAIAVALYLMAVPFFEWRFHMTLTRAALPSLGMFGVCGLWVSACTSTTTVNAAPMRIWTNGNNSSASEPC